MNIAPCDLLFFLQQPSGGGGLLGAFLPLIVIFGIFYFLIIRPQQKRQRQAQADREQMLNELKVGDKVITSGGIYGTIAVVREKDNTVLLRIAQNVSVEVQRSAISAMQAAEAKEVEPAK